MVENYNIEKAMKLRYELRNIAMRHFKWVTFLEYCENNE